MNLFDVPSKTDEEFSEMLLCGGISRIERIVSQGHCSPEGFWYDQKEDEWVSLLCGSALLEFEDCYVFLQKGENIIISAHRRHRVAATGHTPAAIWLCAFGKSLKRGDNA